jgi:alkylation response protein AidB-like acyl-CoA dehydrogenase
VEDAAEHARTRKQFGRAIGEFQAVAHPLADAAIALDGAAVLARSAAWRIDARGGHAAETSAWAAAARLSAVRAALGAVHTCHQAFGAVGITVEGPAFHVSRRIRQVASLPPSERRARPAILAAFTEAST